MLTVSNQTQKTGKRPPRVPFSLVADKVLGLKYDLSLVFANPELARKLNWQYRKRRYIPNVLSFPLEKNSGEIFINLEKADKEKKDFDEDYATHVLRLFIHGLLHLKGLTHSSKMESKEKQLMRLFITPANGTINHHRNRHRNNLHQGSRLSS
ncbi:MAG: rRNA maturation RNase YbeY [bacterium]